MARNADRRVYFVGDSIVVGVGDPERRGWVGRLADRSAREGVPITVHNLGVRRDTSSDIRRRWAGEVAVRRGAGSEDRVVVSFGLNDSAAGARGPRIPVDRSVANLRAVLEDAERAGLPVLVVGPTPVADAAQNHRLAALDQQFRRCCGEAVVPYVGVHATLATDPRWVQEIDRGDGAHPAAAGYTLLAELVLPAWRRWIDGG